MEQIGDALRRQADTLLDLLELKPVVGRPSAFTVASFKASVPQR